MEEEKTKVIFRKFKDGEIIALFPEMLGDSSPYTCGSYMHVGQHSAASPEIVYNTKLAQPEEYKDLYEELTAIGYNLRVMKRIPRDAIDIRRKQLNSPKIIFKLR